MTDEQWYLAYCKPKQEHRAQQQLENQGFNSFLPVVSLTKIKAGKKRTVTEPLFPRYLFIRNNVELNVTKIRSTLGVVGLVKFGQNIATVPTSLIHSLLQQKLQLQQQDAQQQQLAKGDVVEVLSGPFANLNAVFQLADGESRSMVLLQFLGQAVTLSLDNNILLKKQ